MINECNVVRDLLPIYADRATTEDSDKFVKRHLLECEQCSLYYKSVTKKNLKAVSSSELPLSNYEMLAKKLNKRKKVKQVAFTAGLVAAASFGAATVGAVYSILNKK